jgi:OmpA-OmpF porin, OOP family
MTYKSQNCGNKHKSWQKAMAVCVLAFGLCAHGFAQNDPKSTRINAFGRVFEAPQTVAQHQTRLFFYRVAQYSTVKGAASIYVNGAYHASLVDGAYSQLCMPAGDIELGLKSVQVGLQVRDKLDTITVDRSQAGQNHFFRVNEVSPGRQVLTVVPSPQALAEMQGTKEQIHTISRVKAAAQCENQIPPAAQPLAAPPPVAPPPVAPPPAVPAAALPTAQTITLAADSLFAAQAPSGQVAAAPPAKSATQSPAQTISLSADAPFAFGRADLDAISRDGRASLDEMLKHLSSVYTQIDSLHVVGHADPIGRADVNERLSIKRAQTVRDHIQQSGWGNVQITSEGRGSREPVVTHCDTVPTPEAIACHAPNRRVVIDIVGTRR